MRRRTVIGLSASLAAVALVVGATVVWPGLDAQETPEVDTAVWALQTGEGKRYARVNTAVGELDTVRSISNPDQVVQSGDAAYIFSDSYSKVTRIDEALPIDLDDEALESSASTPAGTTDVSTADGYVAYLTDSGAVYAGRIEQGDVAQLDPFPSDDEDAPQYTADAIAVDERGMLFAYSRADASVLRYDLAGDEVAGRDPFEPDGLAAPLVTAAGDTWAVVDAEDGEVWLRDVPGSAPTPTTGTVVVGQPVADGTAVYVAGETSLVRVPADGSGPALEEGTEDGVVLGTPAEPVQHDGVVYAAWLPQGEAAGQLWGSDGTAETLDYRGRPISDQRRPVFVAGGSSMILNELRSGWAWSVPDGALIASSQDWSLDDQTNPDAVPSDEQLQVVLDPKPPVAEPDAFGVRAGSLSALQVLLNDHDPNEDVLTIDPTSVGGLEPEFGTVSITDDGQRLAVRVEPDATGSATFSYAVTDGTAENGLTSEPTTVTLNVAGADAESAPVWCGVDGCLVEWPEPEVALGGTVTVPVLSGWVDPEGDPLLLLSVTNPSGGGSVAATPSGDVVYQHSDRGGGSEELVDLVVTVADTQGQTAQKSLVVRVSPQPALTAQSFAITDTVQSGITVDVADHVTGTAGTMSLESVRVLDDASATATIVGGSTSFDFSAKAPGTYRVDFTVADEDGSDATATARITLLPEDAPAQLATAPVVAFVHPQEDATLDVFDVVSNPTRRVLLLSDVVADADAGATLTVDAVGQNNLRVSGTTEDGGPGRLGTVRYVVSDGTDDEGARVEGEATVYLLPSAPDLAPIAVDDSIVVRAGAQIDIPVLDNDISPAGGRPTLNPATVASTTEDALAFASGDVLRYLAPDEPGEYAVDYSVFTPGAPALADGARVRVRVIDDEANRAPAADTLEGRVLSGQSVLIPFDGFGMDPDGDVVTLGRVVTQPERGSATVAADGSGILYTSVPGDSGQRSFRYQVADAFGETAEGTARVGVLDAEANPSPITFTDYVQVQAGEENSIRVSPLANDVDPTMGELSITAVRPDAPVALIDGSDNPEYARWDERLLDVDDTTVVIAAGEEPATMSFLYDVESSSGNTGRGLIVVKVVRDVVPDYPVVTDTTLTVETRDDFVGGVDVLADKVTWSGGDVSDLELSLWGSPDGVTVSGSTLRGDLPAASRLIPFAVTGEGLAGEVTSYGFLRVPGDDDVALALRAGAPSPQVQELASATFDMAELVAAPRGSTIEIGEDVQASGARTEAACVVESGTVLRYDAGAGAPWVDACRVPVRLTGEDEWTYLSVPIIVEPLDPQPELRPASITVGPGETVSYDLRDMTTWQLREDWEGIEYAFEHTGAAFTLTQQGSILTVVGADAAVPGVEETVVVSVTSHPAVTPARLILRVGAAPSTLPQGGTLVQQCSQASGASCTLDVIGASGEVNPLPGTPLELVEVRPTGSCTGVSFALASATAVTASWTDDAPGATCTASFSVRDAQGRVTSSERDGRVTLDLLGFPKSAASVAQIAYDDGTVTLQVDPGDARLAYPAVEGFIVRVGGDEVARCGADGACPPISAPNGEQRTYEVWALNAVGESAESVRTTAWAYNPPASPQSVSWSPVVTSGDGGIVSLVIDGVDAAQTGTLEIVSAAGETQRVAVGRNSERIEVRSFRVGSNSSTPVAITPLSRFSLPPGLGGVANGQTVTISANGVGAPLNPALTVTARSSDDGYVTVDAIATAQPNGTGSELRYNIVLYDDRGSCDPVAGGDRRSFTGLEDGREYRFLVCVESWYGSDSFGSATAEATVRAEQSPDAPAGYTFTVAPTPVIDGQQARWRITDTPRSDQKPPRLNDVRFENWGPGTSVYDRDPGIRVYYRHRFWGTESARGAVTPAAGSAPYQVQARWSIDSCVAGSTLSLGSSSSNGDAAVAWSDAALVFYDDDDTALAYTAGSWVVPAGAVRAEGAQVTVSWNAAWNLSPTTQSVSRTCDPGPEPEPEPTPTPTPTP
ncbi:hypothetical protein JOD63_002288 [Microbacterium terrae]|uniref:Fibronectin type III domain protein n=1 Tax=Microbacterium terrae TaxID=69369 RepID=A0A0M2GZ63_9MICO|nr:Ig-like domain-containing protein [Microbacterium terrae]KJL39392.1 hypothetical protein RS81_02022 [Microbacterium terrae]MBP1078320.1 hypothetical protein [Microbacterium terrae]GLJ97799.1 fibronectin type III [Microbacterium terrae]